MNVFIVSCVFLPEPVFSATTSADLAEEMVRRGHEVTVFAPFPNRPAGRLVDGYNRKWKFIEYKNDYKIIHSWHTLSKKSNFASRIGENISFGLTSTLQILRTKRPEVVYINTWPIFSQNLNSYFFKRRGVPIVCSVQDMYPESMTSKSMLKSDSWIARLIRNYDIRHLNRCVMITSLSPMMVDHLIKDRGLPPEKIRYIPNWMDASKFPTDLPKNGTFRQKHDIESDMFLAIFAGSLTMSAGIYLYLKTAEILAHYPHIRILLVGDGSMRKELEKEIASRQLNNIQVVSPLKPEEVPEVQAAADVLLLSLSGEMAQNAVPSKQIAYMFSGRPIVASISMGNTAAQILKEADAGFVLPPDNPDAVADLLIKLANSSTSLDRLGNNARKYAEANFSKQLVLPRLANLLESVANQ